MANPAEAKTPPVTKDEILIYGLEYLDNNAKEFEKADPFTLQGLIREELMDQFEIDSEEAWFLAEDIMNQSRSIDKIESQKKTANNNNTTHDKILVSPSKEEEDLNLVTEIAPKASGTSDKIHDKKNSDISSTLDKIADPEIDEFLVTKTKSTSVKEPVLTLNMAHDYYKLKDQRFTTIRGQDCYYEYFYIGTVQRRLQKGDIIRILKFNEFYCDCVLIKIFTKSIIKIPLKVLKLDGEYPDFTINSKEDFVDLINSFIPEDHVYAKATVKSLKTVFFLRKIKTHDKNLVSPGISEGPNLVTDQSDIHSTHDKICIPGPETHDKNLVSPGKELEKIDPNLVMNNFDSWYKSFDKTSLDKKQIQAEIRSKFKELAETALQTIRIQTKEDKDFSIPKISGLIKRHQKCYKKSCRCMKGHPHGPYYYYRIYLDGKDVQIYLGRAS